MAPPDGASEMTEAAAVINRAGPADREAFESVLARSSDEVKQLAFGVRDLVYDVYPSTVEVVWPKQGSVGWGLGPKKFSEQFCYLLTFARHVTLGFYYGGELPDPDGLLGQGGRQVSGKLSMRSLKIANLADVRRPEVRALVEAAVRHLS
jgi:Domain of unknown function (DU1801)